MQAQGRVLTLSDLLSEKSAPPLRAMPVQVPEWVDGGDATVFVAELSADEKDAMEVAWIEYRDKHGTMDADGKPTGVGYRAFTVAFCLCSAERDRYAADNPAALALSIGKRNAKATSRAFNEISRINGITKEDVEALEKKSSEPAPTHTSGDGNGD